MDKYHNLTEMELDAIKEIGNIGVGNAAIALAKILNKKIIMDVPDTRFIPITEFSDHFGGASSIVMSIYSPILGDLAGETIFLFSRESAMGLIDLMMGAEPGTTTMIDEMGESAFKEMANIYIGSYLNAISDMLDMKLLPGVPLVATDMVQAILDGLLMKVSEYADSVLCSKANISIEGHGVEGDFVFLFDLDSMHSLIKKVRQDFSTELGK